MKIVLKRRKHRKGIRPARKGTLKVRMVEFPDNWTQLDSSIGAVIYTNKALLDLMKTPFDKSDERSEKADYLDHCTKVAELFQRGYDFIKGQNQVAPVELALDVINEVTPIFVKEPETDHMGRCKSCEHQADCPYNDMVGFDKVQWCPFLRYDFGTWALNKDKTNGLLKSADMANLALTHLS